jgi:hypothetical protein
VVVFVAFTIGIKTLASITTPKDIEIMPAINGFAMFVSPP